MSKKLINSPVSAVDDALSGLVAVYPGLTLLEGYRIIVRSDIVRVKAENKVTLLSGGGSGHEPSQSGFVGKGMLSAAVCGSVFASPPPGSILEGLRAIASPAGTLMIVTNYTGDRLNFGIAAERAKTEGIKVEMVIVGEDTAIASFSRSAGRRGLCGTVLIHKIAGALAEKGCSLNEVVTAAQQVANTIATMSVSLSPCSIPGNKPTFELRENEMEFGLGIHGEAGIQRTKLLSANKVVEKMIDHMTSSEPGYKYFPTTSGGEVCLIVNNLGGTSNLELSIMAGSAIEYLCNKMKLSVSRVYMGSLMTSLEMAGVSLTLLKMTPQWKECLDQSTTAPGWPNQSLGPDGTAKRRNSPRLLPPTGSAGEPQRGTLPTPPATDQGQIFKRCVVRLCNELIKKEEELNELDRRSGDGDCGSTLRLGAEAILNGVDIIPWDTPSKALLKLSEFVEKEMGGTSGAVYTLFLTSASNCLEGEDHTKTSNDWLLALQSGIDAIIRYGGADVGDRTMLDALVPCCVSFKSELDKCNDSIVKALTEAIEGAKRGAELTMTMEAQAGRASYIDPSLVSGIDPGARAVVIWLEAILKEFQ